jgi:hypothetical protein
MQPNDILSGGGVLLVAMYLTSQLKPIMESVPAFGVGQKLHDSALQLLFLVLNLLLALGYASFITHQLTPSSTPGFLLQTLIAFIVGGHVYSTVTTKGSSIGDSRIQPQQATPSNMPTQYPVYPPAPEPVATSAPVAAPSSAPVAAPVATPVMP